MLTTLPKTFPVPGQAPPFGPWFGISASKIGSFAECPRSWWLATNQGWEGWQSPRGPAPDPASKLAYVLSKLGSLYGVAGNTAGRAVYAYLQGRLERDQLVAEGLARFDAEVDWMILNSREHFEMRGDEKKRLPASCEFDPKGSPGLEEYYYGMQETHLDRRRAAARKMVEDALRGAEGSEYLAAMKAGAFGTVTCEADSDKPETFWLDGTMTWVIPDILTDNGVVRVIDLKAGKPKPEHVLQVQIYAIWAAEKFGKPVKAFLLYLAHGQRVTVDCSAEALAAAKAEMLAKAAEIQERLVDPRCNLGPAENFPQNLRACRGCKFFESCHGHRDREAR